MKKGNIKVEIKAFNSSSFPEQTLLGLLGNHQWNPERAFDSATIEAHQQKKR